jgi:branched-chain amino acid aminotransferase
MKAYDANDDDDIEIVERTVLVDEIVNAAKDGSLKEIFGAGTAAVISPISSFSYQDTEYVLPKIEATFAKQLKEKLTDIQYKKAEDTFGWTVKV